MAQVTVNSTQIDYQEAGSGEVVLLINPGPFRDGFSALTALPQLTTRFRLITYRQRFFNRSTREPVSLVQHASDAAALLSHLNVERAHIVGHSTGACIAMQLTHDRPELVATLSLLEPVLMSAQSAPAFLRKLDTAFGAYQSGDYETAMARFMTVASGLPWEQCRDAVERHLPGAMRQAVADADNWFESYLVELGRWSFGAQEATTITRPVLSVVGTLTDPLFGEGHDLLRQWLPQVDEHWIEGIGHLLQLEAPERVADAIAAFCVKHPVAVAVS
jgi:pimeloyl-ACP methyl ester carboxylesterase